MAQAKICGLTEPVHVLAAVEAGAQFVGFVFFAKSPRNITPEDAAELALLVPPGVAKVGLFVDPDDRKLNQILDVMPLDIIQLHGHESVARVAQVKALTGLPVMKAVGISGLGDLDQLWDYALVADMLLIDAKPPAGSELPGGNGLAFDWRLLAGRKIMVPWLLAGGLTPQNVAEAVRLTGAQGVDVSSGVETAPGQKDADLIRQFVAAATGKVQSPPAA